MTLVALKYSTPRECPGIQFSQTAAFIIEKLRIVNRGWGESVEPNNRFIADWDQ